jgi:hypothetical protein
MGVSAIVNGKYTTFNSNLTVDTTNGDFFIDGWGDSTGFTNAELALDFSAYNAPYVLGEYLYQPNGTPYSSGMTIYFYDNTYGKIGFTNYHDTLTLTSLTDTTFAGTNAGTLDGEIIDPNSPSHRYDSTMTLSNMKFNLRR